MEHAMIEAATISLMTPPVTVETLCRWLCEEAAPGMASTARMTGSTKCWRATSRLCNSRAGHDRSHDK